MSKSKLTFLHQVNSKYISGDKLVVHEEQVVHGDRGLSFKYYHKEGDKKEKVYGKQKEDGNYLLVIVDGEDKKEQTLSKEELIKLLGKQKHLKFILDYLRTQKRSMSRSKRTSRRTSRKASRGSRKGLRRSSRKTSRKASRGSRKGLRRSSRKASRGSRKSRKGSRRQ